MKLFSVLFVFLVGFSISLLNAQANENIKMVADMPGLIAFWDFSTMDDDSVWISYYDNTVVEKPFMVYLKRIGDSTKYTISDWPYTDNNGQVFVDSTGPFGKAFRFNRGYLFGEVSRDQFEETALNLHGNKPFTMIAWVKFYGQRHMATGIWDEGGWNKYSGRRQAALFAGLFNKQSITAHISATGAASYPQSTASGSQYARERAIDGQNFSNNEWIMMAMTFDPENDKVNAMLNGVMTPLDFTDSVVQSVYKYSSQRAANPYDFSHPIYSPDNFLLKYNGYNFRNDSTYEHRLRADLKNRQVVYDFEGDTDKLANSQFRIMCDIQREGQSIFADSLVFDAVSGEIVAMPSDAAILNGDIFVTTLHEFIEGEWSQVGSTVERQILQGAPFTFGRALGLGSGELSHGSQLYIDGVAVFNRILSEEELQSICFVENETRVETGRASQLSHTQKYALAQNYPNPFNPITQIEYTLAESNNVKLQVFNMVGQNVAELVNEHKAAGTHHIKFDAQALPSGVYIYQLVVDQWVENRKMLLLE